MVCSMRQRCMRNQPFQMVMPRATCQIVLPQAMSLWRRPADALEAALLLERLKPELTSTGAVALTPAPRHQLQRWHWLRRS